MILVFNVGSTSIKYSLFDENKVKVLSQKLEYPKDFDVAIMFERLVVDRFISSISDIELVVHRIVFGGQKYTVPTLLTGEVIADLETMSEIAPLHNPPALHLIKQIRKLYPDLPQKAVFDTSFHQTLEPKTYLYGLPYQYYEQYGVRKHGFHGISHSYIAKKVEKLEKNSNLRIVSCHLGGGCSVCAIKDGKSVDISMGFSPEEGLMMATRSGNVGAGAILYLQKKLHKTPDEMLDILNHQSGLLGISGTSGDMRDLIHSSDPQAQLAVEMYCQNIAKYIGSFVPVLGGLDVLTFTGAVGEGSSAIRQKVCEYLGYLGVKLDTETNQSNEEKHTEAKISSDISNVQVWVIPTDEEREMVGQL
jgi:acetate kinase